MRRFGILYSNYYAMSKFFLTNNNWTGFFARIILGIVLFPHGAQKLMGWWGGYGFTGTMQYFTDTVGLPYFLGALVIFIEFFSPLLLIVGFATRINALLVLVVMAGVIITVEHDHFFMNWYGSQEGEGMEFFFLAIGLSVVALFEGGGKFSVDRKMVVAPRNGG